MKRKALALAIALTLLFSVMAGTQMVTLTHANPWSQGYHPQPPDYVMIQSPQNGT